MGGLGRLYPNQYIVLCGGPGLGKTTTSELACNFVRSLNKRVASGAKGVCFGPDKMTPAALIRRFKSTTKAVELTKGHVVNQSAMYLYSTELSTMIKDIGGGSLSDDFLKLYDCNEYFEKEIISDGTTIIPYPCLNILADTTPSFLGGFLPREESGTGLTARIIFATELGRVDFDEEVPNGDAQIHARIESHMSRIFRLQGEFIITPEAKTFWSTWHVNYRNQLFNLNEGSYMRNFYARKPSHLKKIAMALSAGRDSELKILKEDYELGLEIINEAEPYMDKSFGVRDFSKVADASKVVLSTIPFSPEEITKDALIRALMSTGLSGTSQELDGILGYLSEGKLIKRRVVNVNDIYYARIRC